MSEYPPGWSCTKTVVQFALYVEDRLARTEALSVAEHLEACPGCAHQLVLMRMTFRPPRG